LFSAHNDDFRNVKTLCYGDAHGTNLLQYNYYKYTAHIQPAAAFFAGILNHRGTSISIFKGYLHRGGDGSGISVPLLPWSQPESIA
jgi:hypothetical protein